MQIESIWSCDLPSPEGTFHRGSLHSRNIALGVCEDHILPSTLQQTCQGNLVLTFLHLLSANVSRLSQLSDSQPPKTRTAFLWNGRLLGVQASLQIWSCMIHGERQPPIAHFEARSQAERRRTAAAPGRENPYFCGYPGIPAFPIFWAQTASSDLEPSWAFGTRA